MQCANCKSVVDDDALFCPHCAFNVAKDPGDPRPGVLSSYGPVVSPHVAQGRASKASRSWMVIVVGGTMLLGIAFAVVSVAAYLYLRRPTAPISMSPQSMPSGSVLDREAGEVAKKFILESYHKCGDSHFLRSHDQWRPNIFTQIKNFAWKLEGSEVNDKLSEAERLNNSQRPVIQWQGRIIIRGSVYRRYAHIGTAQQWDPWQQSRAPTFDPKTANPLDFISDIDSWRITKVNDKWRVTYTIALANSEGPVIDSVDCNAIPN